MAASPVGPICDRRTLASAPLDSATGFAPLARIEEEDGRHGWILRHNDGDIRSPLYAPGELPLVHTGLVLDVYVGLLVELARAEFPEDGRVRIGRREFLRRIQWADEQGHPAGSAYEGLDAAIAYLSEMQVRSSAIERFEEIGAEDAAEGELTFRILQAHGRVSQLQAAGAEEANRPDAGHRADDVLVYFSTPFVRLLRGVDQRVTYRLSHYLAFKRGAARAFYRYVAHLATRPLTNGAITVNLDDVFASLGSTLRGAPPAKLKQLVNDAPDLLVELGLLRKAPEFTTIRTPDGTVHRVTLRPATPPTDDLKELLTHTLSSWMVTRSVARGHVDSRPEWAATVVAATTLGMLECKKTLPAMVVDYLKNPNRDFRDHELPRFNPTRLGQRRTIAMSPAMLYLEEQFKGSSIYLNGLAQEDQERLRATYSALNRPAWVVDGLVLAACRRFRSGWDLAAYLGSRGAPVRRR
ncbi:MAG TPA: hypothetical protein VGE02_04110 [Gemmatimonadales bacterium]